MTAREEFKAGLAAAGGTLCPVVEGPVRDGAGVPVAAAARIVEAEYADVLRLLESGGPTSRRSALNALDRLMCAVRAHAVAELPPTSWRPQDQTPKPTAMEA